MNETSEDDLILREKGKEVGIMSRTPRKKYVREAKPPTPDPKPISRIEAARRIAQKIVGTTVTATPEEADANALELISNAAEQLEARSRMIRKPKKRSGWLSFLKPKSGNG